MSHTFATRKKMDGLSVFTLRNGRQTMDLDKDKILAKVNKLLSRIESIEQKNAELETKIGNTDVSQLLERIETLENTVEDLEEENTNLKERIAELESLVEEKSEKIEDLDERIIDLDKSVYEMEPVLNDVYARTANYNRGTILYASTVGVEAVNPYILNYYLHKGLMSTVVSGYDKTKTEDELISWNENARPTENQTKNEAMEALRLEHELKLYKIVGPMDLQNTLSSKLNTYLSEPIIMDWLNSAGTPYPEDHEELRNVVQILERLASDITYGSQHIEKNAGYIHDLIQDKTEINNTLVEHENELNSRTAAISEHLDTIDTSVTNVSNRTTYLENATKGLYDGNIIYYDQDTRKSYSVHIPTLLYHEYTSKFTDIGSITKVSIEGFDGFNHWQSSSPRLMIQSAMSCAQASMSPRRTTSTGVCIYLSGIDNVTALTPLLFTENLSAFVPVSPFITSI